MLKFATILSFFLLENISSQAQKIAGGFSSPESVASNGKRFFVSNIGPGKNKTAKDGDGFISEILPDGKIKSLHFLPETGILNSPHGMDVINNILYVADVDKVIGYDINSRAKVFEVSTGSEDGLLNDLEKINDSIIVVSDIFKDVIYSINVRTEKINKIGSVPGPNGLLYDSYKNLLYVCTVGRKSNGTGKLYVKERYDSVSLWHLVDGSPMSGVFDGLIFLDSNHLLLSDWVTYPSTKGRLVVYDIKLKNFISIAMKSAEPADMYIDKYKSKIYLPQTVKDRLIILTPADIKKSKIKTL